MSKKVKILTFLANLLAIASSCNKEQAFLPDVAERVTVSFDAYVSNSATTKTTYDAVNYLGLWKREDLAGVIATYGSGSLTDDKIQDFCIDDKNKGGHLYLSKASFSGKLTDKGNQTYTYYALYPYRAFMFITDVSSVASRLEERQYPDAKSWDGACDMLASKPVTASSTSVAASNLQLQFSRLFGMLRLRFASSITGEYGDETVETISIESENANDKLAGNFIVNLAANDGPDPVMSTTAGETSHKVILDYRGKNTRLSEIDAYAVLNPGTYSNVIIVVKTKDNTLTMKRSDLVIKRGNVASATLSWKSGDTAQESAPLLPKNPESLKIFTYGHSFTLDSMEYMDELLNEDGIKNVTFANFYIGGCSLQEYWNHAKSKGNTKGGSDKIEYHKRYYNGSKVTTTVTSKTVVEALNDEKWDIIVFQTALNWAGYYELIEPPLSQLIHYTDSTCLADNGKKPIHAWHMFWAFGSKLADSRFDTWYYRNQEFNYSAYVQASKEIMRNTDVQLVIPTGTTVQSLRHSSLKNSMEFTRDWYHMDYGAGEYAVGCTWYEYFMKPCFGKTAMGKKFMPTNYSYMKVTEENREPLQRAAVLACQSPFEISHLDELEPLDVTGSAEGFNYVGPTQSGGTESFEIKDNLTW